MSRNKEKCKVLKTIRKKLADTLGVELHQRECTFEGECSGTCPKCQQEEQILNQALLSKAAVAVGVAALSVSLTACANKGALIGEVPEYNTSSPSPIYEVPVEGEIVCEDEFENDIVDEEDRDDTEESDKEDTLEEAVIGEVCEDSWIED